MPKIGTQLKGFYLKPLFLLDQKIRVVVAVVVVAHSSNPLFSLLQTFIAIVTELSL